MVKSKHFVRVSIGVFCTLVFLAGLGGQIAFTQENQDCLKCHASQNLKSKRGSRGGELFVHSQRFSASVHGDMSCTDCHADLSGVDQYPHKTDLDPVSCNDCHDKAEQIHGLLAGLNQSDYRKNFQSQGLLKKGAYFSPVCSSCHSDHYVVSHDNPTSMIHKNQVVQTCTQCHQQTEKIHSEIPGSADWIMSPSGANCVDCHSPHKARQVFYDTQMSDAECLKCHGEQGLESDADGRSLLVGADEHDQSVHGRKGVACAQCHNQVHPSAKERPCLGTDAKVNCSICHLEETSDYNAGVHGQLHSDNDPNAPTCISCHGKHGILEHDLSEGMSAEIAALVRRSPTFDTQVHELCGRCHREGEKAAVRYSGDQKQIVQHYQMSIHGKGLIESGLSVTATCTNCHSPHKELPKNDPASTVHHENIAHTCAKCHDGINEHFEKSVHSPLGNPDYLKNKKESMPDLPDCSDCHSPHTVNRTDLPRFQLGIMKQCGQCHEEVTKSYFDTYHGKSSELGSTTRAKCYDCHSAHQILPPSHPDSTLSSNNIVNTCAQCHAGAHAGFTGFIAHADHHDRKKYPALFYTFWAMTSLLVGTFGFFWLHTLAWLPHSLKMRKKIREEMDAIKPEGKTFVRFSPAQRIMHMVVIISFIGLALTGMMLKFSDTGWAAFLFRIFGGIDGAGWIHRFCALLTFGYFGAHIVDLIRLFRKSKKTLLKFLFGPDSLIPNRTDIREFLQTLKWFSGKGSRPHYGKWTYWEKFDYFAVFWGVAIIGSTGLILWFPEFFTRFLPGWSINIATIIHSDEALLAVGFIFTVHFFNTHFRPDKFPMDTVIFTGSTTLKEMKHDKPRWYEELKASGELDQYLGDSPSPGLSRWARIFGFTALCIGLILVVLIFFELLF